MRRWTRAELGERKKERKRREKNRQGQGSGVWMLMEESIEGDMSRAYQESIILMKT